MNIKLVLTIAFAVTISAQGTSQVRHMLGYVDMREATIWAGTETECHVLVRLGEKGMKAPERIFEATSTKEHYHTCKIVIDGLEPGRTYHYMVSTDQPDFAASTEMYEFTTQSLWQYRTDPPPFKVAVGSCAFINETEYDRPGEPYGGDYAIFDSIVVRDPDLMLWLGDNIYLREVDFSSKSGIIHRYQETRKLPEMQSLLHHCPNVAIWDDHDFGPNDSNGSYIHKDWTLEAFRQFWANPSSGIPGTCGETGITTQFEFSDVEFFLLDNRYNRTSPKSVDNQKPTILGEEQIKWLAQALAKSQAPFKMIAIGGQFLNTEPFTENYSTYPEERQRIIDVIEKNHITGVVFLTGDRHCGELSKLTLADGNVIHDLTVSPLTSKAYDISKEKNTLREDGTIVADRHYAILEVSGKRKERVLTMKVYDVKGKMRWERKIAQPAK